MLEVLCKGLQGSSRTYLYYYLITILCDNVLLFLCELFTFEAVWGLLPSLGAQEPKKSHNIGP